MQTRSSLFYGNETCALLASSTTNFHNGIDDTSSSHHSTVHIASLISFSGSSHLTHLPICLVLESVETIWITGVLLVSNNRSGFHTADVHPRFWPMPCQNRSSNACVRRVNLSLWYQSSVRIRMKHLAATPKAQRVLCWHTNVDMNIIINFDIEISIPRGQSSWKKHLNLRRKPTIAFNVILQRASILLVIDKSWSIWK
jgi:hypothetical protein